MYVVLLGNEASSDECDEKLEEKPGLVGTIVSNMHRLRGLDGNMGYFFIFPDLSVRQEGMYRLRVSGKSTILPSF